MPLNPDQPMLKIVAPSCRRAFTMLELIVVLSILAVLATVAVQSLEPVGKQSRVDATQKTLAELRAAIVGRPPAAGDAQTSDACFVADMGRLPSSIDELFLNIHGVPEFHGTPLAGDDSDVTIARGWRGPYMRLPAGAATLRDGWGNPFAFSATTGANGAIDGLAVIGLGSDSSLGGSDTYSADVNFALPATGAVDAHYGASISGRVLELVAGQWVAPTAGATDSLEIDVTLFTPDPTILPDSDGVSQTIQTQTIGPSSSAASYGFSHPTSNLTIGPRVLKATLKRTTTTTDTEGNPSSTIGTKKGVATIVVRPGAALVVDLHVQ